MNWNKIFAVLIFLGVIAFILTVIFVSVAFLVMIFGSIDSIGKKKYHCENGKCVAGYDKGKTIYVTDNCDNEC